MAYESNQPYSRVTQEDGLVNGAIFGALGGYGAVAAHHGYYMMKGAKNNHGSFKNFSKAMDEKATSMKDVAVMQNENIKSLNSKTASFLHGTQTRRLGTGVAGVASGALLGALIDSSID